MIAKIVMTLNSDVYAKVRAGIHDKLKAGGKLSSVVRICKLHLRVQKSFYEAEHTDASL